MDRIRICVLLFVCLAFCGATLAEEKAAPWAGAPVDDAAVADWAAKLAPAKPAPKAEPTRRPAGTSAETTLPSGNPLRSAAPTASGSVVRVQATGDFAAPPLGPPPGASQSSNPFAEAAASPNTPPLERPFVDNPFANIPSATQPAPAAKSATPPARIAVGASPVAAAPSAALPATKTPAPLTTAPMPEPSPFEQPMATAVRPITPSPAAAPPVPISQPTPQPSRVALATPAARPEPAPTSPSLPLTVEGVGQPGPAKLEGPQEASLAVEKRAPHEAQLGQPCRFVVKVRNTGTATAENVILTDQTPAGAKLLKTSPVADQQGSRLVWRLGAIPAGDERVVEIEVQPLREGPLGSVATVTMDASASAATNCTRPQLALRLAPAQRVLLGDDQPIPIEVHNPGTGAATGVMLVADIPRQLRHEAGSALEYEVGTLAPGESRRVELSMTAAEAGRVAMKVSAVADGDLRAEGAAEFEVVAPSLAVSIDGPSKRYLERPASYTIGVDNPGTAPAKDVRLVTRLPRGMEFVSANNLGEYDATTHSVYWSLAELPEGERGEVQVVAMPVAPGEHTLTAQSEALDGLEASHTHTVQVEGVASLAFEVRDLADPVELGEETVYEIRVLNEGTQAATGVRVRVEAPSGLRVAGADGDTAHQAAPGRVEFAPLARLEPGQKAAFRVRAVAAEAGDQRVTVLVESDDLTRPIRREESTRVFGDE